MKAQELYERASKVRETKAGMEAIWGQLRAAANSGEYYIRVPLISSGEREILEENGFVVTKELMESGSCIHCWRISFAP